MDTAAAPVGQTSPDRIRAILSEAGPQSSASATEVDGSLHLYSMDSVMADIVAQASAARGAFTLVMARPGPGVSPDQPVPTSTAAQVEDLAAALAASVTENQPLLRAGAQHLAVVIPGGARTGRREAMDVMRSAAAQGAPLFTWASAHYPSDASTAGGLVDVASGRLDGPPATAGDAALVADEETGRRRTIAALWLGVAAAIIAGAFAFTLHGGSPNKGVGAVGTSSGSGGLASTSSSGGSPAGTAGSSSGASAGSGSAGSSGYSYTGGSGSSSGGSGSLPSGPTGSSSGDSGGGGTTTQQGSSGGSGNTGTNGDTGTTVPSGSTDTTLPGGITVPTTLPTVTTTTTVPVTGTGNNDCTGLIQPLICTIGGLLKGL